MANRLLIFEKRDKNVEIKVAGLGDICDAIYALVSLIPMGKVTSYSDLAEILNVSPRVVAKCLAINKDIIIVPCHRVVYKTLLIGGYSHGGVDFKKKLLLLEGVKIVKDRVSKEHYTRLSTLFWKR